jgi:hypothetical protein
MSEDIVSVEDGIKTVEFALGDKTIKIRKLRGDEVRTLQKIGEGFSTLPSDMALASIVTINGETLPQVKNEMHLDSRAKRFDDEEYLQLTGKYVEHFRKDLSDPKSEQG